MYHVHFSTRAIFFGLAGLSLLLSIVAALAEARRTRRHDLDRVGWMPWTLIQVVGFGVAAVSFGYALKLG